MQSRQQSSFPVLTRASTFFLLLCLGVLWLCNRSESAPAVQNTLQAMVRNKKLFQYYYYFQLFSFMFNLGQWLSKKNKNKKYERDRVKFSGNVVMTMAGQKSFFWSNGEGNGHRWPFQRLNASPITNYSDLVTTFRHTKFLTSRSDQ